MKELISCADDANVNVYYQFTDGIHFDYDEVGNIVDISKQKHSKGLVGEQMVNAHIDFELSGSCAEVYAIDRLLLGSHTHIYGL